MDINEITKNVDEIMQKGKEIKLQLDRSYEVTVNELLEHVKNKPKNQAMINKHYPNALKSIKENIDDTIMIGIKNDKFSKIEKESHKETIEKISFMEMIIRLEVWFLKNRNKKVNEEFENSRFMKIAQLRLITSYMKDTQMHDNLSMLIEIAMLTQNIIGIGE